jgi:hypothetical protein
MDKDTAVKVTKHIEAMIDEANEMLYLVNNSCPQDVRQRFQQVLGTAVAEIDLELLEPIYKEFPDLRPDGLEEIKSA